MKTERFYELGLGFDKEACLSCMSCVENNGKVCCDETSEMIDIEEAQKNFEICPCLDEERIREEMTEDEYDAYRHGRLKIED